MINKEIKKLLELIETPFFVFYDREEIEKYNAINLQIEKIEFLDDRHYNLKRYIIFDDKLIEINFQKTNNINQVDVIEKEYKINKEIQNKISFFDLIFNFSIKILPSSLNIILSTVPSL